MTFNQRFLIILSLAGVVMQHCGSSDLDHPEYSYTIHRLTTTMKIDADWDKAQWAQIPSVFITNYMGDKPVFAPVTEAKVQYDDRNIYVIFHVKDRYVRSVETEIHGKVWEDACVEFFFAPDTAEPLHYFNVEMNCGGTALIRFNRDTEEDNTLLSVGDMERIEIAHTLPKVVEPEIKQPVNWTLEYRLPFAVLEKYTPLARPKPGVIWRANFQKCAENNSHPHWLTWAKIDYPTPRFHMPQFFGKLVFSK